MKTAVKKGKQNDGREHDGVVIGQLLHEARGGLSGGEQHLSRDPNVVLGNLGERHSRLSDGVCKGPEKAAVNLRQKEGQRVWQGERPGQEAGLSNKTNKHGSYFLRNHPRQGGMQSGWH